MRTFYALNFYKSENKTQVTVYYVLILTISVALTRVYIKQFCLQGDYQQLTFCDNQVGRLYEG